MTGCNQKITLETKITDTFGFGQMPKGEFLRVSVNPYNGKMLVTFNGYEEHARAISELLLTLSREVASFDASSPSLGLQELKRAVDSGNRVCRRYMVAERGGGCAEDKRAERAS